MSRQQKKSGAISRFVFNLLTSGTLDALEIEPRVRLVFTNAVILSGTAILAAFTAINFASHTVVVGSAVGIVTLLNVGSFFLLRKTKDARLSCIISTTTVFMLFLYMTINGGANNSGVTWIFAFPLVAVLMNGFFIGSIYSILLFVCSALVIFIPSLNSASYMPASNARILGVYILICVFTFIYEYLKDIKDDTIAKITKELHKEKEEIKAMKDNMDLGVCLINRNCEIQPFYSDILESIFEKRMLENLDITYILKDSLTSDQVEKVKMYIGMLFEGDRPPDLMEELNPLTAVAVSIKKEETGIIKKKYLNFKFRLISSETERLLVTIKDITQETLLEERVKREHSKREEEKNSIYEVLKASPALLIEFITDTEDDMERLNERYLKDTRHADKQVLEAIFRFVHKVKGNALIIGLTAFGSKLHSVEDEIKGMFLEKNPNIYSAVQDIANISAEIAKTKEVINFIRDFNKNIESSSGDSLYLFDSSIVKAVDEIGASLGKKIKCNIKISDRSLVMGKYRKPLKDSIAILARNAIYHGIEAADERILKGKPEQGMISIEISQDADSLLLSVRDDGSGLDIEKLKASAVKKGIDISGMDKRAITNLIFKHGFSTSETENFTAGRGLGMDILREIVSDNKGKIIVKSEGGKGCTFDIMMKMS